MYLIFSVCFASNPANFEDKIHTPFESWYSDEGETVPNDVYVIQTLASQHNSENSELDVQMEIRHILGQNFYPRFTRQSEQEVNEISRSIDTS